MNNEWSELSKTVQEQLKKKETFALAIETLLMLRGQLMAQLDDFKSTLTKDDFSAIPFKNAAGYHNKTIAYSLFHLFRIEDIVANSLIRKCNQIFFDNDYQARMNSDIITTGNELSGEQLEDFSKKLNIDELYQYIKAVDNSTAQLLKQLSFEDTKVKMTEQDAERLHELKTVSEDEKAVWLIEYWCGKDVKGLIQMPFSRHWIMHVEACLRIKNKLRK